MNDFLSPLLKKADSLPFLFVGSGFSRRYLGLPNWNELLEYIASITYEDSFGYVRAKNEATKKFDPTIDYNNYMTALCDIISNDLDNIWYTDDRFKTNRLKHETLIKKQNVPPIKIEIAEYINSFKSLIPDTKKEIESLQKISTYSISGIITTNYDTLLEDIFGYHTYTSQEELLFHSKFDLGEIYKIHGCSKYAETILINTADYKKIEEKHKYISAKLLTIFLEHPIFFIGYSVGDEDIRKILADIQSCLSDEQLSMIADRLFYVVWDSNEKNFKESTYTITFDKGRSLTMRKISINDYSILYDELSKNKSKYPVKMLRYVKEDMYNLVLNNDPKNRMMLSLPDEDLNKDDLDNIEFVYGFGMIERAKNGYKIVNESELFQDIVFDNANFSADLLVSETIPLLLQKTGGFLPYRKYIKEADIEKLVLPKIITNNLIRFNTHKKMLSHKMQDEKKLLSEPMTISRALSSKSEKLYKLALVDYTKENIEELGDFLRRTLNTEKFETNSDMRRLIRIYDLIKYK